MGECGAGIGRGGDCQPVDTEPELPNLVGVVGGGGKGGRNVLTEDDECMLGHVRACHVGFHVGIDVTWSQF